MNNSKNNIEKKKQAIDISKAIDFQRRNENNVEFKFSIKTPKGESIPIGFARYEADFEELNKKFQLRPGQKEQFKITMKIEITDTQRSANNYRDLMQHFLSRPPLRKTPVPKDEDEDGEIKYFNTETLVAAFLKDPRNTLEKGKKTYVKNALSLPGAPKIKDGISVGKFINYINKIGYKCSAKWIKGYKEEYKG